MWMIMEDAGESVIKIMHVLTQISANNMNIWVKKIEYNFWLKTWIFGTQIDIPCFYLAFNLHPDFKQHIWPEKSLMKNLHSF